MKKFLLFVCISVVCHGKAGIAIDGVPNNPPTTNSSGISIVGNNPYYRCGRDLLHLQYFCHCTKIYRLHIADVRFFDSTVTQLTVKCNSRQGPYNVPVFDGLPSFIKRVNIYDCLKGEIAKELLQGLAHVDLLDLANLVFINASAPDEEGAYHDFKPVADLPGIVTLDPEFFSSVQDLKKLNLNWLVLTKFPEALYHRKNGSSPLKNLEILALSSNNIPDIRPEYFSSMSKLRWLDLTFNALHNLSNSFLNLHNLQNLYITNNFIETLDGSPFRNLIALGTLVLSQMRPLKNVTLPGPAGQKYPQRGALRFIYSSSFVGLSSLKILDLSWNSIQLIQNRTFQHLSRLEQLDLSIGLISTIEDHGFEGLKSLLSLDLSYNNLSYINNFAFNDMPTLQTLNLEGNFLKSLSEEVFLGLRSLSTLKISYNHLTDVPTDVFQPVGNLERLSLHHNYLRSIEGFLSELQSTYCKEIDISFNNVSTLDASILPTLAVAGKTVTVNLSHNAIDTIHASNSYLDPSATGRKLHQLKLTLDLRWNRFRSIPFHLNSSRFFRKPRIVIDRNDGIRYTTNSEYDDISLQMQPNPIVCDCRIYELLQNHEIVQNGVLYVKTDFKELTCHNPEYLNGRKVVDLSPSEAWCQKNDPNTCPSNCSCMIQGEHNSTIAPWNERVDCSSRNLSNVPNGIPTLTTFLHLERNNIRVVNRAAFMESHVIRELYLSYNNITEIEPMAFSHLKSLEILYLDGNNINGITGEEFLYLVNLRELYLNSSTIQAVGSDAFRDLLSLKALHLESNLLEALPRDLFSTATNLQHLALASNHFRCDCDILWFKYWMKNKESILVGNNITCTHEQSHSQENILSLSEDILGCDRAVADRRSNITIGLSVLVVILSLLMILGIVLYKKKTDLQVYIYARYGWRFKEEKEDMEKPYDAFLSYSQHDLDFVLHDILPGLENREPPFRVCLHHRDFIPGIPIADNILNAVEESRRTIVVISRNFLESEWCQLEFQAAHAQVLRDRANRLIIVLFEDNPVDDAPPDIKHYLKTNTYLKWGDERFWERLVYVMPRPKPSKQLVQNMEQEPLEMSEAHQCAYTA